MNNTVIWKYTLDTTDTQKIKMPFGAQILTVQSQKDNVCLWALVDPSEQDEEKIIETHGTGNEMYLGSANVVRVYIGTYQLHDGDLVFHVFERKN